MRFFIAAWVFVFATGLLIGSQLSPEDRRNNRGIALFMLAVMGGAAYIMYID